MLILVLVILGGLYTLQQPNIKQEPFQSLSKNVYNPSKFYTTSPNKFEKAHSLYSPFITRPKDLYAHKYDKVGQGRCTNELYPKASSPFGKGEITGPCKPDTGGKYYGQRPILNTSTLQSMIKEIFKSITTKVPKEVKQKKLIYQNQFSNASMETNGQEVDSYTSVMKYILNQINRAQNNLQIFKDYSEADVWGGDTFAYLNEEMFMFTEQDPSKYNQQTQAMRARKASKKDTKYVVTFTLYLPLRSMSLDTTAIVIEHKGKYYIKYINFTTEQGVSAEGPLEGDEDTPEGVNLGEFKSGSVMQPNMGGLPPSQNTPNWIYGNSLENKTFNLKGFHDPDESNNILIPGGVPDEYNKACDMFFAMLLPAKSMFSLHTDSDLTQLIDKSKERP